MSSDGEKRLILNNNLRFKVDNELQNFIDKNILSNTEYVNQKNLIKDFMKKQFEKEQIIDISTLYKNKDIPIIDPEINRLYQIALIIYMSILSHNYGIKRIKIQDAVNISWDLCSNYSEFFTKNEKIRESGLERYMQKFGVVENGILILNRPVVSKIIDDPQTNFFEKVNDLYNQIHSRVVLPLPCFLYEKMSDYEELLYNIQHINKSSVGTELVYTRGRKNRLIYKRIEEMILFSDNCFRIMMAYMSDEVKILYGLIEKLKRSKKYEIKIMVRSDDKHSDNKNAGAIMDLKNMINKLSLDDEERDGMLNRLQVKYFRSDPSLYYKLHAKLLICDEKSVLAGSANLIPTSLESNIEVGFYSEDTTLVHDSVEFFEDVWNQC